MALAWKARGEGPPFAFAGRYEVRGLIGGGRTGVVYRALDRRVGRMVALKTLRTEDPDALYRLKREFRTLAGLAHRNLVSFFDLVVDGDERFFTMELVEGTDFVEAFRGRLANGEPPDPVHRDLRDAIVQLASGLDALHRRGILHRDVKPANVLIAGDGRLVLLDFGLALETAAAAEERAAGTMGYLAPEHLAGRGAGVASDWFSVGAMLYETLTGRMPFEDRALLELLAGRATPPPAPRTLDARVPADLDALALALLDVDPLRRPVGSAVLARLATTTASFDDVSSSGARPALVGRVAEACILDQALRDSRRAPFLLRLSGASGIGKSALIEDFVARARRDEGALVLATRCHPNEEMPFRAVDGAIDALARHLATLGDAALATLLPPDVAAARRVFPVLGRVPRIAHAIAEGGADVDPIKGRREAFRALRELLSRLASERPLVLWIDDVQWADLDSAALLRELRRPPDAPRILLLLSGRSDAGSVAPFVDALQVRSPTAVAAEPAAERVLELGPLARADAAALAHAVLGRDDADARTAAARIADESQGSPLFAVELARHLALRRDDAAHASPGVADLVGARIAALPAAAREALELIAIAGRPLASDVVRHALSDDADPRPSVALLRAQFLVRALPAGDEVVDAIDHDRIRETVLALTPPATLRVRHLALARALERDHDADPRLLVHHYEQAGDVARAADLALAAGRRAAADLAFHQAAELYARALDLGTTAVSRSVLEARIGLMLTYAGRAREAAARYEAAALASDPDSETEPRRSALRRRAAELYLRTGLYEPGVAALRRSLADSGVRYARSQRAALLSILLHRARLGLRRWLAERRPPRPANPTALDHERLEIYWSAGVGLSLFDMVRAADFQLRHALLAQEVGDPRHRARALATEAMTLVWEGGARNRRRSVQILDEASRVAATVADPRIEVQTLVTRAAIAFVERRYREALALCERGASICATRHVGTTWEIANLELCAVSTLSCLGELAHMRTRLVDLLQRAADRGDLYSEISLRIGMQCLAWLAADEPGEARRQIAHARAAATLAPFQEYCAVYAEAQCDLYSGDAQQAWDRLRAAWPGFRKSFVLRIQGVRVDLLDLRARCALALLAAGVASARRRARLERVVARAVRRLAREGVDWVAPVAAALRAALAARRGDRAGAIEQLERAAADYAQLDMAAHAAAARLHLARLRGDHPTSASAALRRLGIADVERFAALLVPAATSPDA